MRYSSACATAGLAVLMLAAPALAQERRVDPTWLHRNIDRVAEKPSDISAPGCHYFPMFGAGDADNLPAVLGSVARFGKVVVDPGASCARLSRAQEDQIVVVLKGTGTARYDGQAVALKAEDFLYLPAGMSQALVNQSAGTMTAVLMGFHTKGAASDPKPNRPLKANIADVATEQVGSHPQSAHYRLLLGDAAQTRDKIDVGRVVTSLFLMEIDPGGTNFPHHHADAEEIYLVLDGKGEQVAGAGQDGVAARFPASSGDAWFFRLNATMGYYGAAGVHSRILCVRSFHPKPE